MYRFILKNHNQHIYLSSIYSQLYLPLKDLTKHCIPNVGEYRSSEAVALDAIMA